MKWALAVAALGALMGAGGVRGGDIVPALPSIVELDNGVVRAVVDTRRGGAVVRLVYEKAYTFPLIRERGAGVAGSGVLFSPAIEARGVTSGGFAMAMVERSRDRLVLRADPVDLRPGVTWTRRISLPPGASSLAIEDEVDNASAETLSVRLGSDSLQQSEPWRLTDRSWLGSESGCAALATSDREPATGAIRTVGRNLFWRQIEQYGTGLLCRWVGWPADGQASASIVPGAGEAVRIVLRSPEIELEPHGWRIVRSEVAVDEGGGAPDQGNAGFPVLARADFAHAGRSGRPLLGYATVASPAAGSFLVVVRSDRELLRRDVTLEPGKVARLSVSFVPEVGRTRRGPPGSKGRAGAVPPPLRLRPPAQPGGAGVPAQPSTDGDISISVEVTQHGRTVGNAVARALIDGRDADPIWQRYTRHLPEEVYRGTWEQIGEQLVQGGQPIGQPTAMPMSAAKEGPADNGIAFYEKAYPLYAELLRGAAKTSGVAPNRIFLRAEDEDTRAGCMDAVYYGPDGPINAFSKERYGPDFHGEGYVKVLPAQGYAFHFFESYGVNSAGLSISGAASSEDWHTHEVAEKRLAERIRAGGHTLPAKAGLWLIYATCRTVDEALRVIDNPEAPLIFTGNMFLVDRAGNAARVESVGIERQIFRHRPEDGGLFVAGNYLHRRSDGLFGIGQWSWAANTMLREHFLADFVGSRQGSMSLADVFAVMQTHEAGGMCQHHHDDPARLYTACSYIAVPRTSELWLAEGPPCETEYVRHRL